MTAINSLPVDLLTSGAGTLGRLIADSAATRMQMNRLSAQSSSGLVADSFAGLGAAAGVSLVLRPALAQQDAWRSNIDAAAGRMTAAQTALAQIADIATDFYARTNTLNGLNAGSVDSVALGARDALQQVASLLNTRFGDVYVFSGKDSRTPPIADPGGIAATGFFTGIQAAVSQLDTSGAAGVAAATLALAGSDQAGVTPFSAYLSQSAAALADERPMVETGLRETSATGILATRNGDAVSRGDSTTGSYVRDILRALATLGSLGADQNDSAQLGGLVADTRASLGAAISALGQDAGMLGDRQRAMTQARTRLDQQGVALETQLAGAEQVDMAKTLSQLTQVQTQLQGSYQLIAAIQGMSLVKYL